VRAQVQAALEGGGEASEADERMEAARLAEQQVEQDAAQHQQRGCRPVEPC
jgi:hypothetical protein